VFELPPEGFSLAPPEFDAPVPDAPGVEEDCADFPPQPNTSNANVEYAENFLRTKRA